MKSKVLKVRKLNGQTLSDLVNTIPRIYLKKANELFDFLYNDIFTILYDVVVIIENTEKHLIFIPYANISIDMFSSSLEDFWGMEQSDVTEPFAGIDMWNSLSHNIAKSCKIDLHNSRLIHYFTINEIIKLKKRKRYILPYFINRLTGAEYYKEIGYLDQKSSNIIESRSELMSLFHIKCNDIYGEFDDEEPKDNPFILEGEKVDLCIYSSNSYIIAFSPKRKFLREINQEQTPYDSEGLEDGHLRYVFVTFKWEKEFGMFLDENKKRNLKKSLSFSEEAPFPLMFMGIYRYCQKESLKEGLFVWKLVETKVEIPLCRL